MDDTVINSDRDTRSEVLAVSNATILPHTSMQHGATRLNHIFDGLDDE